jgi:hypothetical protein
LPQHFEYVEELHFSVIDVHLVSDVRQIEIHTAEPLVRDPSPSEVETATAKLKRYRSPGSDQILISFAFVRYWRKKKGSIMRQYIS